MELGETAVGSSVLKSDIIGVILIDIINDSVQLLKILSSLNRSTLCEKIDLIKLIS